MAAALDFAARRAIASIPVIVIVSGRKHIWNQLNTSKAARGNKITCERGADSYEPLDVLPNAFPPNRKPETQGRKLPIYKKSAKRLKRHRRPATFSLFPIRGSKSPYFKVHAN